MTLGTTALLQAAQAPPPPPAPAARSGGRFGLRGRGMTFGQRAGSRDNNFDFLRFSLAILVVFHHSFALTGSGPDTLERLTHGQITGAVAVWFFFAISGLLITQSWMRSAGPWPFFSKRALRIYPGLFVALLFCVLVVGPLAGVNLHAYFHDGRTYRYFGYLLLASGTNPPGLFTHNPFPYTVNGSLWTIPCEIVLYALVAALGMLNAFRRRGVVLALLLALLIGSRLVATRGVALSDLPVPVFGSLMIFLYFTLLFVVGMAFCLYADVIPYSRRLLCVCLVVTALCLHRGLLFALPFCGTYVLFYLAFNRRLRMQDFGRKADLSYGTYLYAYPVQQLLVLHLHNALGPVALFAVATPVTVLLASLSWRFVEKPCRRLKRRQGTLPGPLVWAAPGPAAKAAGPPKPPDVRAGEAG